LVDAGGTPLNSVGISYWSSTEKDASAAWTVNFSLPMPSSENQFIYSFSGELVPENKTTTHNVRAVRSIPAPSNYYDTTLTYLWNTGDTEPHFQVTPEQTTDYSVTVTNAYGCTNTASVNVMVLDRCRDVPWRVSADKKSPPYMFEFSVSLPPYFQGQSNQKIWKEFQREFWGCRLPRRWQ
jgi:hypothetical protein